MFKHFKFDYSGIIFAEEHRELILKTTRNCDQDSGAVLEINRNFEEVSSKVVAQLNTGNWLTSIRGCRNLTLDYVRRETDLGRLLQPKHTIKLRSIAWMARWRSCS